jgi:2-keto-4-pentenoate hydratase/2-oxohepta-3-ene-1,7-dioic acid hydratase in catechol pathway
MPADRLWLRSPVTTPCRVVAQAVNYPSHAEDAGVGEDPPPVYFRKSSASVSGPTDDVVRPRHVRLLDYELEVGLVMGHRLPVGAAVGDADLPDDVLGHRLFLEVVQRVGGYDGYGEINAPVRAAAQLAAEDRLTG